MSATQQFTMIAQAVPGPRFQTAASLANTILRTCDCLDEKLVPHYVYADGWVCSVCGKQTLRNDRLELVAGR